VNPPLLNRREAIARLALLFGGTVIGGEAFLRGTPAAGAEAGTVAANHPSFSAADRALLDEIGDTIIPTTNTPGAKAAGVGAFMVMMVAEYYDAEHQDIFRAGLGQLATACQAKYGRGFVELPPAERKEFLNALDTEQRAQAKGAVKAPPHYFLLLKQLTLLGYFSSEIGCTQALRYLEVPGAFHGDVPYKKGDRAWYTAPRPGQAS
jgi:hypothetical protein